MTSGRTGTGIGRGKAWLAEARDQAAALDRAISAAIDQTATPALDRSLVRLSEAANGSRLWIATAAAAALLGGPRGRRAAAGALASIGLASAVSNLALKSVARRRRPEGARGEGVPSRRVRRPVTGSFPSGHAASAFAFASTMGEALPATWAPLHATAALVAYSRVHTGVHYASDVVTGALVGAMSGWTTRRIAGRLDRLLQPGGGRDVAAG